MKSHLRMQETMRDDILHVAHDQVNWEREGEDGEKEESGWDPHLNANFIGGACAFEWFLKQI